MDEEQLNPVDLNLINDLWVPNVFIYNLKTFKVGTHLSQFWHFERGRQCPVSGPRNRTNGGMVASRSEHFFINKVTEQLQLHVAKLLLPKFETNGLCTTTRDIIA